VTTTFPKQCSCCSRTLTHKDWEALPLVGFHEDPVERLELRNCSCGSTLSIMTEPKTVVIARSPGFVVLENVTYSNKSTFGMSNEEIEVEIKRIQEMARAERKKVQ